MHSIIENYKGKNMNNIKITVQDGIALLALAISLIAVWFTWKQVEISQTHNRLSVTPILQLTPYLEGVGKRNGLYLTNDGLGPALIKTFSVTLRGDRTEGFESDRWGEIVTSLKLTPECFGHAWPRNETTISAGVEIPLIFVTNASGKEFCFLEAVQMFGGEPILIELEYESIYGDRKTVSADSKIRSEILEHYVELISHLKSNLNQ